MRRISRTVGAIVSTVVLVAVSLPVGPASIAHADGGTISGVVRNANGDPIPNATVRALRDEIGFIAPPVTVTADVNGAFTLTGLTPAEYRIGASAAGYAARYANAATFALATRLTVVTGGTLINDITLFQPTAAISGRIIDDLGNPVVGASVGVGTPWPMGMYPYATLDHFGRTVLTGADGTYSATGFAPGSYTMNVTPAASSLVGGFYPTLKPPGSSFAVAVGATVTGIDLTVVHAGTVTGRITSPSGAPVAGAYVFAEGWGTPHQTLSAADGTYTLTGVEPGPQIIFAETVGMPYMTTLYGNVLTGIEATSINVPTGGTIGNIDIEMIEGVEVQVQVLDTNGQGSSYLQVRGCRTPDSPVRIVQAPSPLLDCQNSTSAGLNVSLGTNGVAIIRFAPGDYNLAAILADNTVTSTASVRVTLGDTPTCTLRASGTSHCSPIPPPVVTPPVTPPVVCSTSPNGLVGDIGGNTTTTACPDTAYAPAVRSPVPTTL